MTRTTSGSALHLLQWLLFLACPMAYGGAVGEKGLARVPTSTAPGGAVVYSLVRDQDARAIADALTAPMGGSRPVSVPTSPTDLTSAIERLAQPSDAGNAALIYLSGALALDGGEVKLSGLSMDGPSVTLSAVREALRRSTAARTVLLVEASTEGLSEEGGARTTALKALAGLSLARAGVTVLVTTGGWPSSCPGLRQLACVAVAGLSGGADRDRSGQVSSDELLAFVERGLPLEDPSALTQVSSTPVQAAAPRRTVEICLAVQGRPVPLDAELFTHEQITLTISVSEAGHVRLIGVGQDGEPAVLYPYGAESDAVGAGQVIEVPPRGSPSPLILTPPAGEEHVSLLWARAPFSAPDEALEVGIQRRRGASELAWTRVTGTKGLARVESIAPTSGSECGTFSPTGDADAWVVEFSLRHPR